MSNIKVNLENTGLEKKELMKYNEKVEQAHDELHSMADKEDEDLKSKSTEELRKMLEELD